MTYYNGMNKRFPCKHAFVPCEEFFILFLRFLRFFVNHLFKLPEMFWSTNIFFLNSDRKKLYPLQAYIVSPLLTKKSKT